jgi:putative membrane protein
MVLLSDAAFVVVALLHGWFLVLEMFLWERPLGLRTFGQTRERAAATAVLARNQGLYNGFLAAGIVWGLAEGHGGFGIRVRLFFGACVVVAGAYGALTTGKRTVLWIQSGPAAIAVATLLLASQAFQ